MCSANLLFRKIYYPIIKLVDMDTSPSSESIFGMLVYFLSLLVAVFLGPLEAVLGLALYSLLRNSEERRQTLS